jgi:hypothetical protein
MSLTKTLDYQIRVSNILKVFTHKYGHRADLVNVNSLTIGSATYEIMKTILDEHNIAIEIDDRVAVGKFMFVNRELAASDNL